jgi:hypothetical protein
VFCLPDEGKRANGDKFRGKIMQKALEFENSELAVHIIYNNIY